MTAPVQATVVLSLLMLCTGCSGFAPPWRLARQSGPDTPTAEQALGVQVALARTLERQGDLDQAENAYRQLVEKHPDEPVVLHRLAVLTDRHQRYEESASLFQRALELQPDNPNLLCDIGYSLYLQCRWDEAESNLRQAIAVDPRHRRAHNHLGMLLARTDRRDDAMVAFRNAGCSEAEAHLNLALALAASNQPEAAQQAVRIAENSGSGSKAAQEKIERMRGLLAEAESNDAAPTSIATKPNQDHWPK